MPPPSRGAHPPHHIFLRVCAGALAAIALFELLHRVFRFPEYASALLVGLALLPALVWAVVRTVSTLLAAPDDVGHALVFALADLGLTILFFAFLYLELGIVETATGAEVRQFWPSLYFSVSTITTSGLGDFVPSDEARFLAAIEMVLGYLLFGILTAAAFFLLSHRSRKP